MKHILRGHGRPTNRDLAYSLTGLFVFSTSAFAQLPSYVAAQFGPDNRLTEIVISREHVPDSANAVLVKCQGFVGIDGVLSSYHCITPEVLPVGTDFSYIRTRLPDQGRRIAAHRDLLTAVIDNIPELASFLPAHVGGKPVRVLMSFGVLINCSDESCVTVPIQNHGYSYQEYGYGYVSPQPILADDAWYKGFDYKLEWIQEWMPDIDRMGRVTTEDRFPVSIPYTMSAAIDTDGVVDNSCLNGIWPGARIGQRGLQRKLAQAVDSLGSVRFIPGFHRGQPVPMRFYETSVTESRTRLPASSTGAFPEIRCESESPPNGIVQ